MDSMGRNCKWFPVVAIPARNEAQRLPALIDSLSNQSWLVNGRRLHVVLVLNNCEDGSARAVMEAVSHNSNLLLELIEVVFPTERAHVGSARRLAMERARTMCSDPSRSVLLTTDADAFPTPTWIEANLRAINSGADMVGGLIMGDEVEEALLGSKFLQRAGRQLHYARLCNHLAALIDPLSYDPWPRHWDHTGASLAIRADVYATVGGIPALPFREDLAFVSRVRGAGYRLRHSLDVCVKVSARLDGRAPGGMADCLKAWVKAEEEGAPHIVEDPKSVAARLDLRRKCRNFGSTTGAEFSEFARRVAIDRVCQSHLRPRNVPALIELVAPDQPDAMSSVAVEVAIGQLERMIASRESQIRAA